MTRSEVIAKIGGSDVCESSQKLWKAGGLHEEQTNALRGVMEWMVAPYDGATVSVAGELVVVRRSGVVVLRAFVFEARGQVGVHVNGKRCEGGMELEDGVQRELGLRSKRK